MQRAEPMATGMPSPALSAFAPAGVPSLPPTPQVGVHLASVKPLKHRVCSCFGGVLVFIFGFVFFFFFYMMGVKAKGSEISQNPKEEQSQETKIPAPQSLGSEHTSEKSPDIVKGFSAPPETPTFTRAHLSHLLIWTPKPWSSVQNPKLWVLVVFPNLGTNLRTCFVQGKADWIRCCPWRTSFL